VRKNFVRFFWSSDLATLAVYSSDPREHNVKTDRLVTGRQHRHFAVETGVVEELPKLWQLLQSRRLIDLHSAVDPILDRYDVDAQPRPVDRVEDFQFRSLDVERQVVDVRAAERRGNGVQRETDDVDLRLLPPADEREVRRVHLADDAAAEAGRLEANGRRSALGAEARPQHVRPTVPVEQRAVKVRVGLDEQSGPVALQLEEQRVGTDLAVAGAALDEEAVSSLRQQTVDERRLAVPRRVRVPRNDAPLARRRRLRDLPADVVEQLLVVRREPVAADAVQYVSHLVRRAEASSTRRRRVRAVDASATDSQLSNDQVQSGRHDEEHDGADRQHQQRHRADAAATRSFHFHTCQRSAPISGVFINCETQPSVQPQSTRHSSVDP